MKVDTVTIIGAPCSNKNTKKKRDPETHQARKGNQWFFGMHPHVGVDSETGLTHSAVVTAVNVHYKRPLPDLLRGQEPRVYGDYAYVSQGERIHSKAPQALEWPTHLAKILRYSQRLNTTGTEA